MFSLNIHYDQHYDRYTLVTIGQDGVVESMTLRDLDSLLPWVAQSIAKNLPVLPEAKVKTVIGFKGAANAQG